LCMLWPLQPYLYVYMLTCIPVTNEGGVMLKCISGLPSSFHEIDLLE
jgi:hypothetical protein